jgi:tRNA(fMet)-specific endonuclease VapC
MIHLDANVAIALLNARPPVVRDRFDAARSDGAALFMSSIVLHELMFGAAASQRRQGNEEKIAMLVASGIEILSFDADDAGHAGDIRAYLKRAGTPIGPYDVLIAAQARRRGATLVTANGREFERVPGLSVTDWAA